MENQGDDVEIQGDIVEIMVIHVSCNRPRPALTQGPMKNKHLDI